METRHGGPVVLEMPPQMSGALIRIAWIVLEMHIPSLRPDHPHPTPPPGDADAICTSLLWPL